MFCRSRVQTWRSSRNRASSPANDRATNLPGDKPRSAAIRGRGNRPFLFRLRTALASDRPRAYINARETGRFRSGQTGQTVNLLALRLRWFESSPAHFSNDAFSKNGLCPIGASIRWTSGPSCANHPCPWKRTCSIAAGSFYDSDRRVRI